MAGARHLDHRSSNSESSSSSSPAKCSDSQENRHVLRHRRGAGGWSVKIVSTTTILVLAYGMMRYAMLISHIPVPDPQHPTSDAPLLQNQHFHNEKEQEHEHGRRHAQQRSADWSRGKSGSNANANANFDSNSSSHSPSNPPTAASSTTKPSAKPSKSPLLPQTTAKAAAETTTPPKPPVTTKAATATATATATSTRSDSNSNSNSTTGPTFCKPIYFWGGGKSGSTTLYSLLMFGPHWNAGSGSQLTPFARHGVGKEPCQDSKEPWKHWAETIRNTELCAPRKRPAKDESNDETDFVQPTHVLNGCPRRFSARQARPILRLHAAHAAQVARATNTTTTTTTTTTTSIVVPPKFVMLVRDPVDRMVSHLNDLKRRGGKGGAAMPMLNIEQLAQTIVWEHQIGNKLRGLEVWLSQQGAMLRNLLAVTQDPESVLVVPMESLSSDPQRVVDAIMDHVGGARWTLGGLSDRSKTKSKSKTKTKVLHANNGKKTKQYEILSRNATEGLRSVFRSDVLLLEQLVGKHFPWSSWAYSTNSTTNTTFNGTLASGEEDWIATTPRGWDGNTSLDAAQSNSSSANRPVRRRRVAVSMPRWKEGNGNGKPQKNDQRTRVEWKKSPELQHRQKAV